MSAVSGTRTAFLSIVEGERAERGEVPLDEAAEILKVSRATAYQMISSRALPAQQLCGGAPWIIRLSDLLQTMCAAKPMPGDHDARYLGTCGKISFLYKGIIR